MSKGFSLVEMLVTVSILGALAVIATVSYNKQKETGAITWAKAEMTYLSQLMKTAKSADGAYHQFIYMMGYRPKGKQLAAVGTKADGNTPCCDKYPDTGTTPCEKCLDPSLSDNECRKEKKMLSGWLYYNCNNDPVAGAPDNIILCDEPDYEFSCNLKEFASSPLVGGLNMVGFTKCKPKTLSPPPTPTPPPDPSTPPPAPTPEWCNCDHFTIGAITYFDKELSLNNDGELCD